MSWPTPDDIDREFNAVTAKVRVFDEVMRSLFAVLPDPAHFAEHRLDWHPVTARKAFWALDGSDGLMLCDACGHWTSVSWWDLEDE